MNFQLCVDIKNVGVIVPLPNHYNFDMPQGHGAVRIAMFEQLFFFGGGNIKHGLAQIKK